MAFAQHQQNAREVPGLENAPQLRVYRSWDELASIAAAWERLLENSVGPTIFSTPEWLGAWWRAYGQGKQLLALTFWDAGGELVGLAPFYIETLRGAIRRLRLLGDGSVRGDGTCDSDNLDLIFRSGQEEVCSQALLAWLDAHSLWDLCELNRLPTDSPSARHLLTGLQQHRWPHFVNEREKSSVVLPDTWESYKKQLPKDRVKEIERRMRKLQQNYAVHIDRCSNEEDLAKYLEALFELHQKRWNSRGNPGSFVLPERRRFYADMSRTFFQRGWLQFWLLELDGEVAAVRFAFRYGDTIYGLQSGFDPEHQSESVGIILWTHLIKRAIAEGVRHYDFLGGSDSYKFQWGAQPGSYTDICFVAAPFSSAYVYVQLRGASHTAGKWLRKNAPSVYSRLLGIYGGLM